MYTSIYSGVSKVRQVKLFFENTKPNPCKISLWQRKTNLQNNNTLVEGRLKLLLFTGYLWKIRAISVKREEKSRETTGTWKWKCFYNPFCHLPSADNFPLISQRNSGSKWKNDSEVCTCNIIIVFAGSSVDIRHLAI